MTALWLDEIGDGDRGRVGAKAHVLALLRREGLRVPDGFVLPAGRDPDAEWRSTLVEAYERLGGVVAVRSSSTAEDLDGASFAGQYRTFLAVEGRDAVVDAAVGCLASASGGREYARAVGAPAAGEMAVLVQRFVEPRAAGVAFTRHPRDPSAMLVESHAGRGEAVVSGSVRPDAYVLDRGSGDLRSGPVGGSLKEADLRGVADLSRRVESILGAPQDVEWAIGPEGLALLQARPITVDAAERADPTARRLTRANVGEVLPDPVTPLTWSTVCGFLEHGFRRVARRGGLGAPAEGRFLVLYRRRLYLNLTLSVRTGMRLPGMTRQAAERLLLGGGSPEPAHPPRLALSTLPSLASVAFRLAALARRLPAEVDAACARVAGLAGDSRIQEADEAGLRRLLRLFAEAGQEIGDAHIATSGSSALRLALLGRLIERWCAGDPSAWVNRLVAGLPGVASAAPTLDLESVAAEARQREDWGSWLRERSAEQAASQLRGGTAPPDLATRFEAFLRAYGHRALSEGELAATTWRDDPSPLFAALGPLLASTRSPGFGHRSRADARDADEEALLSRLGPFRSAVFRFFMTGAQTWVRERERTKSAAVALVDHGRRLVRAAARRLVASGALHDAGDIFFLTQSEIEGALEGQGVPTGVVERRRRRHEREAALPAPREVDLDAPEKAAGPSAGALEGIAASAGVGAGPARVLLPGDAPRIEPGEVLVAPVLDAALGPLLASAAAAVAEIGGMLSHGSVVARELGVPCVVDVRDATRRIRPGERVLVDGDTGRISVMGGADDIQGASRVPSPPLVAADPADERLHRPEPDRHARESVYLSAQDPATGMRVIATAGLRRGVAGESVVALALPDGRVLFGLDLRRGRIDAHGFSVGGANVGWAPPRLRFEGRLAVHEAAEFPPWPPALVLAPRTASVAIDLTLRATTPAVDLCETLSPEARDSVLLLGRHHVEQSGLWTGEVRVDGVTWTFDGTGSRDHSWGLRDWNALDHSRLFTLRIGDDFAVHALALSARGRRAEGGFVWDDGRLQAISRIDYALGRDGGRVVSLELEVTTREGTRRSLRGVVERTLTIPVEVERRLSRLVTGRPYGLVLHEGFTRYELEGRAGHGIAELSERPR